MEKIFEMGLRLESPIQGVIYPCSGKNAVSGGFVYLHIHGDEVYWRPT